jgi:hypothetical protein
MSDDTAPATPAEPAPPPTARVRLLETIEPSATDKTRYEAGTDWTFSEDRALALVEAGQAKLLPDAPAAADAPEVEPAAFVGDDEE